MPAALWVLLSLVSAAAAEPCPTVVFADREIALDPVERRLVCGDRRTHGWSRIPLNQARYFLRGFLQKRGYHEPRFDERGEILVVSVGPQARVRSVTASGLPPTVDLSRRRGLRGQVLTPKVLDELKAWLVGELQDRGHACPVVEVTAVAPTGLLHAEVDAGPLHVVTRIEPPQLPTIDPAVLARYEAFRRGRDLDMRLLRLTSTRIVDEDLFLSAFYDVDCSTRDAPTIRQRVVAAPPRLVSLGFGVDTEGLLRGRARWKNARIGYRASSFQALATASFREQAGELYMRWYPRPDTRWHWVPRAEATREDETSFEQLSARGGVGPAFTRDNQRFRFEGRAGPNIEYVRTFRGTGPPDDAFLSLTTRWQALSHIFEYHLRDPREGWQAGLDTTSRQRGVYSEISAHRARLSGQALVNIGGYDPPLVVFGWRGSVGTTWTAGVGPTLEELPAALKFFLGGDADIRGFGRKGLPADGQGFLTAGYTGLELRAPILPWRLEPLAFMDAAVGGRRRLTVDRPIYVSPGLGARWASPVGVFRATAARGMSWRSQPEVLTPRDHWQFFLSFGREF